MCVRIQLADVVTVPWDPQRGVITIPAQLDQSRALRAVRRTLAELHVLQPDDGAVCWCGAPVPIEAPAVPSQRRRPPEEEMRRGA
jgi:hypothetical protein